MLLAGYRDGAGDSQGERAAHADGGVQYLVEAAQIGAPESRQAVQKEFVHGAALIDATGFDVTARAGTVMLLFVGHKLEHSRRAKGGAGASSSHPFNSAPGGAGGGPG